MRPSPLLVVLVLLTLGACGSPTAGWYRVGFSDAQNRIDLDDCTDHAYAVAGTPSLSADALPYGTNPGGYFGGGPSLNVDPAHRAPVGNARAVLWACLEDKGFTRSPPTKEVPH